MRFQAAADPTNDLFHELDRILCALLELAACQASKLGQFSNE